MTAPKLFDKRGTLACLACGKPAKQYTGHVHIDGAMVFAGWCKEHADQHCNERTYHMVAPLQAGCLGCFGHWTVTPAALRGDK